MKIETSKELVRELAAEFPNERIGELNRCRFCGVSWPESDFVGWLEHEQILQKDPEADDPPFNTKLRWHHHRTDCLWVRANQTVRRDL